MYSALEELITVLPPSAASISTELRDTVSEIHGVERDVVNIDADVHDIRFLHASPVALWGTKDIKATFLQSSRGHTPEQSAELAVDAVFRIFRTTDLSPSIYLACFRCLNQLALFSEAAIVISNRLIPPSIHVLASLQDSECRAEYLSILSQLLSIASLLPKYTCPKLLVSAISTCIKFSFSKRDEALISTIISTYLSCAPFDASVTVLAAAHEMLLACEPKPIPEPSPGANDIRNYIFGWTPSVDYFPMFLDADDEYCLVSSVDDDAIRVRVRAYALKLVLKGMTVFGREKRKEMEQQKAQLKEKSETNSSSEKKEDESEKKEVVENVKL
ncbi:hypothetical protein ADUPG1_009918, partial [Aduncisulcus paluster]